MATLAQSIPRIFRHAWQRYGKPVLTAVRPMAEWNLPATFVYDQTVDEIRDPSGVVLNNPEDYWVTDLIYIVPNRSERGAGAIAELAQVLAGGQVSAGTVGVWVLGADDVLKIKQAHALQLNGQWYDLAHDQAQPTGYPTTDGLWAYVRLKART